MQGARFFPDALRLLALCALLLLTGLHRAPRTPEEQTTALQARSYPEPSTMRLPVRVQADTLSYVIQSGEVLILNLPPSFGVQSVQTYRIKRAPALSWLVNRSYFWRTLATDVGEHTIAFEARSNGRPLQEVIVLVDVR